MKYFSLLLLIVGCKSETDEKLCINYNEKLKILYSNAINYCEVKDSTTKVKDFKLDSMSICRELFKTEFPFELLIRMSNCTLDNFYHKSNFKDFNLYREKVSQLDVLGTFNNQSPNCHSLILLGKIDSGIVINNILYKKSIEVTIDGNSGLGINSIRGTFLIR